MNLLRVIASTLAGLVLACSSPSAQAAAAVAVAENGKSFTATDHDDVERAKAAALQGCRQMGANCTVTVWTSNAGAIALVNGTNGNSQFIHVNPESARAAAMQGCRKRYKGCKFTAMYWEPGGHWAAWGVAKGASGELVHEYFAHQFESEAGARDRALAGCQAGIKDRPDARCMVQSRWGAWTHAFASSTSHTGVQVTASRKEAEAEALRVCRQASGPDAPCKLDRVIENPGPVGQPAGFAKVVAQTVVEQEKALAARPRAPSAGLQQQAVTCTNRCVNGSCVRSFPDGRTERWQAPRVFDPFKGDWKWETSSCGG